MAVETVSALTELTSPAANDEIGIWDVSAGEYKKIQQSNLVGATITGGGTVALGGYTLTVPATGTASLLGTAQTYSAKKTFSSGLDTKQIEPTTYSLASDGVVALSTLTALTNGLLVLINKSAGQTALFVLRGGFNTTVEALDPSSAFSATKDNASTINCYYDSGYKIQSKAGAIDIIVLAIGAV